MSDLFEKCGIARIDTDAVYHELTSYMSACLSELVSYFGKDIVRDGALDRRVLSDIVFNKDDSHIKLEALNRISHKHVLAKAREMIAELESRGAYAVLVDAPMLFESGFNSECDVIISVLAEEETRIRRIVARDNISAEDARRRISSQHSNDWLAERSDYIIYNNGNIDQLSQAVKKVAFEILK